MKLKQSGFTLIELMVGVVLGMLTVIVIAQVIAHAEANRRTVATGGDAEINGSLSLFTLQRDIQMAGYGLANEPSALGCPVKNVLKTEDKQPLTLAPLIIDSGADGGPDTITIMQGNTVGVAAPMQIVPTEAQLKAGPTSLVVLSNMGVSAGDILIATKSSGRTAPTLSPTDEGYAASLNATNSCRLVVATQVINDHQTIKVEPSNDWNQVAAPADYVLNGYGSDPVTGVKNYLINIGRPSQKTYRISNNNLQVTDWVSTDGSSTAQDLYPQIITMKALYGKDNNADGVIDGYDNITPTNAAEWRAVISVRIALVARSNHFEKEKVTTAEPLWDVGAATPITLSNQPAITACPNGSNCIKLKIDGTPDWEHYRYKVYSTTIPLRNVLWNS